MCALSKYNETSNIMRHPFLSENLHSKSINIPYTTKLAFSDSASLLPEAGKLSVHYATFPALYLTPAECTKEQNDQIQESDAGASVGVSG